MDLPFYEIISELQKLRREHPKGTIQNLLYKEMGNSLYGSVAKGLSHKMKYDIKADKTVRMESGPISNPIMASHITATVRSLVGLFLEQVSNLGGKAVSITTDGFITDKASLEATFANAFVNIESGKKLIDSSIYKAYSEMRYILSGNPLVLELKHEGKNLTS